MAVGLLLRSGGQRHAVACRAEELVLGNGRAGRIRSLLAALVLVLAVAAAGASSAHAEGGHGTGAGTTEITCSHVTWSYSEFPNAENNTVTQVIHVDGELVSTTSFSFNGPSGLDTVTFAAPDGESKVDAHATWKTNGAKGNFDHLAKVNCQPNFSIEKQQEIKGSGTGFTNAPLTGELGQTVDYQIVVTNTGNLALTFSSFTDPHCDEGTISGGPGGGSVAPGASTTYTCEHVLSSAGSYTNEATDTGTPPKGPPITKTSNKVVVNVLAKPAFAIEKLQEIKGSGAGFTAFPLIGAVGQTVDYEIVVTNTGNVALTFSNFTDAHCDEGTISGGPGGSPVAPGGSTTYTCEHVLSAVGSYGNEASDTGTSPEGTSITHTSNEVLVDVPAEPAFSIEKLQEIKGSGAGFTTGPLTGKLGQTVDYEIVVSNTGNVALTFSNFTDVHCDEGTIAGGPGGSPVAPGGSTTYTCEHVLSAVGSYGNEASDTGTSPEGTSITHTSNEVLVNVPALPAFSIEKLQEIKGSGAGFTTGPVTGKLGDTVDYEIVVTNTGEVPLTFSNFTDVHCDEGTIAGGPGESPVAPGGSTTYTCEHVLTAVGSYGNEASDTGTSPQGVSVTKTSNEVVATVPAEPAFSIEKLQEIKGSGAGFTTGPLSGKLGQTVDYEIVVSNTGNVALTFSNFTDVHCDEGTIADGPGGSPVAPGASSIYTCDHVLSGLGSFGNEASDTGTTSEGASITNTSNEVVVNVPAEPAFSIEKLQEIKGSGAGFTTSPLSGKTGQTVDYEIVVTNTGNVPLTFSNFTDVHCDEGTIAGGPGGSPVAPGGSTTYTCEHVLSGLGSFGNEASDTGTTSEGASITNTSNEVVVNVPAEPAFSIEKLQEIKGSGAGFTKLPLDGEVGQTVDYEIVVTNTGNVPLTFSKFTDPHCDKGTISGGPGSSPVAPGASSTYLCDHLLTTHNKTAGSYSNTAEVTGTPPEGDGSPIRHTSNTVVTNFPGHGKGKGSTEITCTQITFFYSGFPNAENNTVTQYIKINGVLVSTTVFTFNGPSGSDVVTISAPPGTHSIDVHAKWKTNGVSGSFDHHVKIICE